MLTGSYELISLLEYLAILDEEDNSSSLIAMEMVSRLITRITCVRNTKKNKTKKHE